MFHGAYHGDFHKKKQKKKPLLWEDYVRVTLCVPECDYNLEILIPMKIVLSLTNWLWPFNHKIRLLLLPFMLNFQLIKLRKHWATIHTVFYSETNLKHIGSISEVCRSVELFVLFIWLNDFPGLNGEERECHEKPPNDLITSNEQLSSARSPPRSHRTEYEFEARRGEAKGKIVEL